MRENRRACSTHPTSKLMLHEGVNCLVFDEDGDITSGYGRGLYYDDIRYLSRWQLRLDGESVQALGVRIREPNQSVCFVTNPKLDGVKRETLGIVRTRILDGGVRERIAITNYGDEKACFELSLHFDADFRDVSEVENAYERGESLESPKGLRASAMDEKRGLVLDIERKGIWLGTRILFDQPARIRKQEASFRLEIAPGEEHRIYAEVMPVAIEDRSNDDRVVDVPKSDPQILANRRMAERKLMATMPTLKTDHPVLGPAYQHALGDLASLSMVNIDGMAEGARTIAAGVPWYTALFGRDSLTTARLMLLADPDLAVGTLRILGELQGKGFDESTHEQPGKILHAFRRNLAEGQSRRSARYRTLDATPLYLLTACEHVQHQDDLSVAESLWPILVRAVEWIENCGDSDDDGLLKQGSKSGGGWKDSSDSVRYRDGSIVNPPVALVEIQGYAIRALELFSSISDKLGHSALGERTRRRAERMRAELVSRYWMEERSFFAQALDGQKKQVDSLTSNVGQLLWCRAIPPEYARRVMQILMSDEFFSGWGIRTRASSEGGFNPVSYHNGSVWPHDNAIIASGFASYGFKAEARKVLEGMLAAMAHYPEARPPEVIAGYPANPSKLPVAYFGANPLQAWASAGVVEMLRTVLGLEVDAPARRVSLSPFALEGMSFLSWQGVHIGGERVDIEARFEDGKAHTVVRGLSGEWRVEGAKRSRSPSAAPFDLHW